MIGGDVTSRDRYPWTVRLVFVCRSEMSKNVSSTRDQSEAQLGAVDEGLDLQDYSWEWDEVAEYKWPICAGAIIT